MPQTAVPFILKSIGAAVAGLFGFAAAGAAALAIGTATVVIVAVGIRRAAKLRDVGDIRRPTGKTVLLRSTEAPRGIVYGQQNVGGVLTFANSAGDELRQLYFEVVHTGHEIDSYQGWWVDDKYIPIADVDDINASPAGDGSIDSDTNSHGFGPVDSTPVVYLRGHLGASDQSADSMLVSAFPTEIGASSPSTHRHRGCSRTIARFDLLEGAEEVFDNRAPANVTAVVKGKKVYDPRQDGTLGYSPDGGHRVTDSSTWAWSDNPALIWADYLIDSDLGPGWDYTRIDYSTVASAADDCDTLVNIPPVASPQTQEKRFTCNLVVDSNQEHNEIITDILATMAGSQRYFNGQWHVYAGVWQTADFTLSEDDLIGPIEWRKQPEIADRYNQVRGTYIDPNRSWKVSQFLTVNDTTLRSTRDNSRVLAKELDLPGVTGEYEAQRLAFRALNQADNTGICIFPMGYQGADIRPGDTGTVTIAELGWSAKTFRCVGVKYVDFVGVELTLKEDSSGDYSDPSVGQYGTRTAAGAITFPSIRLPPVDLVIDGNFTKAFGEYWTDDGNGGVSIVSGGAPDGSNILQLEDLSVGTPRQANNIARIEVIPGATISGTARMQRTNNISIIQLGARFYRSGNGAFIGSQGDDVTVDLVSASTWYTISWTMNVPNFSTSSPSALGAGNKPLMAISIGMTPTGSGTATLDIASIEAHVGQ